MLEHSSDGQADREELPLPTPIELARRLAALTGLFGLVGISALSFFRPEQLRRTYVAGLEFWVTLTAGCLVVWVLARQGRPGGVGLLAPFGRAALPTVPLLAVLALPLALHRPAVPSWSPDGPWPVALTLIEAPLLAMLLFVALLGWLAWLEPTLLPPPVGVRLGAFVFTILALTVVLRALAPSARLPLLITEAAALPLLLWHGVGARPGRLTLLTLGLFLAHFVARVQPGRFSDLLAPVAIGGLWLAYFFSRLDRHLPTPPVCGTA